MRPIRSLLLTLFVVALAVPVWADGLPTAEPEDVGLSSERLERVTDAIEADVKSGAIPGAVAMIARDGKIAYFEARGKADTESGAVMKKDTIFRIYSMSKPITSVALMMLFEEGKFKLKDPVSKFIPELGDMKVLVEKEDIDEGGAFNIPELDEEKAPGPAVDSDTYFTVPTKRDMTVQDLLRHTAGFTYGFFGNTSVDKLYLRSGILSRDRDVTDMVDRLSKIPLQYQPGTRWHYSVSVDVQGRLIEVLSGMGFDEFLEERIFNPLKMVDTGFYVPDNKLDRFAQMYAPGGDDGLRIADARMSRNFTNNPTMHSGGGGMVSTATDYMRFCQMMLNGGVLDGERILSRKTVELMTIDHLGDVPERDVFGGYGFGLGFAVATDLARTGMPTSVGEYRWGGAAGTRFWIDPKEKLIGVYMVQIIPHPFSFGEDFKIFTYQSIAD